jgi:glycosyltransferase involved in cell wall biosynthesis
VAFDLTGPKDIISDGITGFLAPRFDKEGFYCAVKNNLYFKRKNLYTLRKKALEVAEQYSGRTINDAFDEVYGNTF